MSELRSILDALMECPRCGQRFRVGDCEPDIDGEGSLGCPVPDCGGTMGMILGPPIFAEQSA